jgi:hypothetical protein
MSMIAWRCRIGLLLMGGFLLCLVIVAGCGGAGTDTNAAATNQGAAVKRTKKGFGSGVVEATLHPVGKMPEAKGKFQYIARLNETRLINLRVTGLDPVSGERQYAVWQKGSRWDMVLLATWHVGHDASQRFLEDGSRTTLLITKVGDHARLEEARNSYEHIYIGIPVLEGKITGPLIGINEGS